LPADHVATKVTAGPATLAAAPGAAPADHGKAVYAQFCAGCHGALGEGGVGTALKGERTRKTQAQLIEWIKNPKLPMPKLYPAPLTEQDVKDVAAYVGTL
jgi:ubiquinol-cytochrome c reductase cytochrome c subunit